MSNHSLTFVALISFSIVSYVAAIPMDADQAVIGANHNVVLHKDMAVTQGGYADKDVADDLAKTTTNLCPADTICASADVSTIKLNPQKVSDWFATQGSASALQPVAVLLTIIGLIVFFLSRKSVSAK